MSRGRLYVVAAPSGAGKTSLVKALISAVPEAEVAVSHTTRPMRKGEADGVNYYFVDEASFQQMQAEGKFAESARVFGNLYGTSKAEIERINGLGKHVILEIDWQGARQIREAMPKTRSIFILPPSLDTLRDRLRKRAQDDEKTIEARMAEAISEISHYDEFDFIVVNDRFQRALGDLIHIVQEEPRELSLTAQQARLAPLIRDLLPSNMP